MIFVIIGIIVVAVIWAIATTNGFKSKELKITEALSGIEVALNEVFDKVKYIADGHIPDGVIKNTDMGFDSRIDKVYGSDYIKAEYKGVSIELSDINAVRVIEYRDDDGRTYIRFLKQGKLVLAINTGGDSFEVNSIRKASAEALREQFISEVRYVTDLIDELKLVKTLHTKSNN